ncbi:hypothetical protein GN956_G20965 [Arapaima gigas]
MPFIWPHKREDHSHLQFHGYVPEIDGFPVEPSCGTFPFTKIPPVPTIGPITTAEPLTTKREPPPGRQIHGPSDKGVDQSDESSSSEERGGQKVVEINITRHK